MNRTVAVRLAGVAIAAAALSVMWSQAPRPALTIEKVTDNLYVIFGSGGNVAVMPTTEGVILVDDKFAQDAPDIVAKVKTVSEKPIRYILNTHQHGDHTGGNQALMAASAEIVIHKNARANMVTNSPGCRVSHSAMRPSCFWEARRYGRGTLDAGTPTATHSSISRRNVSCTPATCS
jgi:glyoxylase-like metal-dependent hydrolase (beta-lactamase superfamily II)